jgi:hypothetical protein
MPSVVARFSSLGSAAQASVPGVYAWAMTVAPVAWSRSRVGFVYLSVHGTSLLAEVFAVLGLVTLAVSVYGEKRWGVRMRYVGVWGLVLTSSLVWLLSPGPLGPLSLDAPRGIAGMLGWALFAFASAAPALHRAEEPNARVVDDDAPLRPRAELKRGDAAYIVGAVVVALALQAVGWRILVPERALLVRFVSLAAGLALVTAATSVSLSRHGRAPARLAPARGARRLSRERLRLALPWLVALVMLGVLGVVGMLRS